MSRAYARNPTAVVSGAQPPALVPSSTSPCVTSLAGFGNGKGRSNTPSTIEKMAVVAPMPNASVSTAVSVNPGDLRNWRSV